MTKILLVVGATVVIAIFIPPFIMKDWHLAVMRENPILFLFLCLEMVAVSAMMWGAMLSSRWIYKGLFWGAFIVSVVFFVSSKYYREAREIVYRNAAEHGDANAKYELGQKYEYGFFEVEKNEAEATNWYREAAKLGHVDAQYRLGNCYAKGNGVATNEAEAVKWFHKAAEQGHVDAQCELGRRYYDGKGVRKNEAEAVKWLLLSAEQGNGFAQFFLGRCYKRGDGIPQSEAEAEAWFGKIKSPEALCAIGSVLLDSDKSEAVKWLRRAAEQEENSVDGHGNIFVACAQHMLGLCYLDGAGVPQNREEGIKWLKKSAKNGNKKAQDVLDEIFKQERLK